MDAIPRIRFFAFAGRDDAIHFPEQLSQRTSDSTGPAADFEHLHQLRILLLADVAEVGQDFVKNAETSRLIEISAVPARVV